MQKIIDFFKSFGWMILLVVLLILVAAKQDSLLQNLVIITLLLSIWSLWGIASLYSFNKLPFFKQLFKDDDPLEQISKSIVVASIFIGAGLLIGLSWYLIQYNVFK